LDFELVQKVIYYHKGTF